MAVSQPCFRETVEFQRGHNGERMVAELLQQHGWYVIPSYDYAGEDHDKAPRLQGALGGFIIPDLDIAKDGARRWAEVKTKAEATFTRITQRLEHGISKRHYEHYQKVQQITGDEVWLFVVEENTGTVLFAKLDDLEPFKRVYNGDKMSRGGMVFYPRDCFKVWQGR